MALGFDEFYKHKDFANNISFRLLMEITLMLAMWTYCNKYNSTVVWILIASSLNFRNTLVPTWETHLPFLVSEMLNLCLLWFFTTLIKIAIMKNR